MALNLFTSWECLNLPLRSSHSFTPKVKLSGTADPDLVKDLQVWLDNQSSKCRVSITIAQINDPNDGAPTTEIILNSTVFGELQTMMSVIGDFQPLKLSFKLSVYAPGSQDIADIAVITLDNLIPHVDDKHEKVCSRYIGWDRTFQSLDIEQFHYDVKLDLSVDASGYIRMSDLLSPCDPISQSIFQDMKYSDFDLVSKDGSTFTCHKIFLRASSSVLKATIDGEFTEGHNSTLLMSDMTDATVEAFLEFVYCKSVDKAYKFPLVAFELLKAADYYAMDTLWSAMKRILMAKPSEWFTMDVALELFEFVLKKVDREGTECLKEKSMKVLALNMNKLDSSQLFLEMFATTPSRDMFKETLKCKLN